MTDRNDIVGMDCQRCREGVSARLDGEATATESAAVDVHLGGCADCRAALERAERVTRMARGYVVEPGPDPAAVLLAAWDAVMADAGRAADPVIVVPAEAEAPPRPSAGCGSNVLRLRAVGASACACAAGCACGCQSGRPCRCGSDAA